MAFLAPAEDIERARAQARSYDDARSTAPVSATFQGVRDAQLAERAEVEAEGGFLAPDEDIALARTPMRSAQEDAAGQGIGEYIAHLVTRRAPDPANDASDFLDNLRQTGPEGAAAQQAVTAATGNVSERIAAVNDDMAHHGVLDLAGGSTSVSRAMGRPGDTTEEDRRAAYDEGFKGREFWNTDEINVDPNVLAAMLAPLAPFLAPASLASGGEDINVRGPAASVLAAGADITGAITGSLRDLTAFIGAGKSLAARVVSNVIANLAADVAGQGLDIATGTQEGGYVPERTLLSGAAGAAVPVALHVAGDALRTPGTSPRDAQVDETAGAAPDETARASRGADDRAETEDVNMTAAQNRARAELYRQGVAPTSPDYRARYDVELNRQLRAAAPEARAAAPEARAAAPEAQAPPTPRAADAGPVDASADQLARAREAVQARKIAPRDEGYVEAVDAEVARIVAEDAPAAAQAREAGEQAFQTALRADPQTRVRTTSSGSVTYVRDTGQRARGRIVVDILEPDENGALRVKRAGVRALPGELKDIPGREQAGTTPAPSPSAREADPVTLRDQRDTSSIPILSEDRVKAAMKQDPAVQVRSEADQAIVREAAERGADADAVERYRAHVEGPKGDGRKLTTEQAGHELRDLIDRLDRVPDDDPIIGYKPNAEPPVRDDDIGGFARRNTKRDQVRAAESVSRETASTVSRETASTTGEVPLAAKPKTPEPAPRAERTVADVGWRLAHRDKAATDEVGEIIRFADQADAARARDALAPSYAKEGELRVEGGPGGYILRVAGKSEPPVRAGPLPPRTDAPPAEANKPQIPPSTVPPNPRDRVTMNTAAGETSRTLPTDAERIAELERTVEELKAAKPKEGEGFKGALRDQRNDMDDVADRTRSRAILRGAPADEPTAKPETVADRPDGAPPEPATYRNSLYDDDYEPPARAVDDSEPAARVDNEADDGLTPREREIEADRPGLAEATRRREALAAQQRGAFGERDPSSTVEDIPDWRHDVTPDRFAREYLQETAQATDIDRIAGIVKSGRQVAAALDHTGKMYRLPVGTVSWTRAFARKAGISSDVGTSQVLRATRSADVYGTGNAVYIRVSDQSSDEIVNAVMRMARALHNNDPDLEIRLEVHGDAPQVHAGWKATKAALDGIASRGYLPPHQTGAGAFEFMNPDYWGRQFQSAIDHARGTMQELLDEQSLLSRDELRAELKSKDASVLVVDSLGRTFKTKVGDAMYWMARFRQRAKLQRRPEIGMPRTTSPFAGLLENDVLNATRTVTIENMGDKIELRMPERLDGDAADALRRLVGMVDNGAVRARVFSIRGDAVVTEGKSAVLTAIAAAEARPDFGSTQLNAFFNPFNPAAVNRLFIQPSMRAMTRYMQSWSDADPARAQFWVDVKDAMNAPPASGSRRVGAWRTLANVHDTLVVSDIGALRGLARRYPDAVFTPEEAAAMGDNRLAGKNILEWLGDQVGSEPGTGRVVPRAFENEGAQDFKRFTRRMDNIMSEWETALGRRTTKAEDHALAELVTGTTPATTAVTHNMRVAAKKIRAAFDDEWTASRDAGMNLGTQKNYLARNFDIDAIQKDHPGFLREAAHQYMVADPALSRTDADAKARALLSELIMPASPRIGAWGSNMSGGLPNPTAARTWRAGADARMRRFYVNDIRKIAVIYGRRMSFARAYARRFGAKGERLQTAFDAMTRAVPRDADRNLIAWHMKNALGQNSDGAWPQTMNGALSWVSAWGVSRFLARTFLLQAVEPMMIAARENKGAATAFGHLLGATRSYFDNSPSARERAQLADLIGLTGEAARDMYLDARLNGLTSNLARRFTGNVLDAFGITGMTERQRIYAMGVGERVLRHSLDDVATQAPGWRASASMLAEYGIAEKDAPALLRWITSLDRLPREDRLQAIGYGEFAHARGVRGFLHDFAIKSILEPTAAETPGGAKSGLWRMAYSLTGFQHAFTREVLVRMTNQFKRAATDKNLTFADQAALLAVVPAFIALASAQLVMQGVRTGTFSSQANSEKTPLEQFITYISRIGGFGNYDGLVNTVSSNFRYERDPAGLVAGPYLGQNIKSLLDIVQGMPFVPGNSENTNKVEWQAVKEGWGAVVAPAMVGLAAQVPLPGPLALARTGASAYATSSDASRSVATAAVGERSARTPPRGTGLEDFDWDSVFSESESGQ